MPDESTPPVEGTDQEPQQEKGQDSPPVESPPAAEAAEQQPTVELEPFVPCQQKGQHHCRPYCPGECLEDIHCFGHEPKEGDYVLRDPRNQDKQWLVTAAEFQRHYRLI